MYNGVCVEIKPSIRVEKPVPSSIEGKYVESCIILKAELKIFAYNYTHLSPSQLAQSNQIIGAFLFLAKRSDLSGVICMTDGRAGERAHRQNNHRKLQ